MVGASVRHEQWTLTQDMDHLSTQADGNVVFTSAADPLHNTAITCEMMYLLSPICLIRKNKHPTPRNEKCNY